MHIERGVQYTSLIHKKMQKKYMFTSNLSRVSQCLDNQPIERFWEIYKAECFYLEKYEGYDDLLGSVKSYIQCYNNHCYTERLNGLSPNEY